MQRRVHSILIECNSGNITQQPDMTAVVNAANAQLRPGGGVAGAIHTAAGPGLERECHTLAPIRPGQAVVTGGHDLPNPFVIHCLGPVYGQDEPSDGLLSDCIRNALKRAEEKGVDSVAFPALSTGAFGYPIEEAAEVMLRSIVEAAPSLKTVRHVRFVLFGKQDLLVFERELERLLPE